uniref:Uncharacterized protein n=1 Tax=Nelumbo nucifera TaxID=4432 RepID=A0A822YU53_NELNU|nr:TPA_asm: hypothetical protein HUJ06_005589 [Nelumbo nucifera]
MDQPAIGGNLFFFFFFFVNSVLLKPSVDSCRWLTPHFWSSVVQ